MIAIDKLYGRIVLQLRGRYPVVGWGMNPGEAISFIRSLGKTVLTFIGFSVDFEDEKAALEIIKGVLAKHTPDSTLVNIGATKGGVGIAYSVAKSMGFLTTGIISTEAFAFYNDISEHVDHICFIRDRLWGGYMPGSMELSPTSRAMIDCSDFLVGIGGNEVARDELLAGKDLGKPVQFSPAEMNHEWAIRTAQKSGKPLPTSFFGSAHEVFGKDQIISTSSSQTQG
jgi:hypothetical protein